MKKTLTDELVDEYLRTIPDGRKLYLEEPVYHLQVDVMRKTMTHMEEAMRDEGMPADIQRKLLLRALYGMEDREAAMRRLMQFKEQVKKYEEPVRQFNL